MARPTAVAIRASATPPVMAFGWFMPLVERMPKAAIMPVTVPSSPSSGESVMMVSSTGRIAAQPAHLGLRGRFHGRGGRGLPLGQARRDHARGRGAGAAGDLERLVQLAALGQLERALGGAPRRPAATRSRAAR